MSLSLLVPVSGCWEEVQVESERASGTPPAASAPDHSIEEIFTEPLPTLAMESVPFQFDDGIRDLFYGPKEDVVWVVPDLTYIAPPEFPTPAVKPNPDGSYTMPVTVPLLSKKLQAATLRAPLDSYHEAPPIRGRVELIPASKMDFYLVSETRSLPLGSVKEPEPGQEFVELSATGTLDELRYFTEEGFLGVVIHPYSVRRYAFPATIAHVGMREQSPNFVNLETKHRRFDVTLSFPVSIEPAGIPVEAAEEILPPGDLELDAEPEIPVESAEPLIDPADQLGPDDEPDVSTELESAVDVKSSGEQAELTESDAAPELGTGVESVSDELETSQSIEEAFQPPGEPPEQPEPDASAGVESVFDELNAFQPPIDEIEVAPSIDPEIITEEYSIFVTTDEVRLEPTKLTFTLKVSGMLCSAEPATVTLTEQIEIPAPYSSRFESIQAPPPNRPWIASDTRDALESRMGGYVKDLEVRLERSRQGKVSVRLIGSVSLPLEVAALPGSIKITNLPTQGLAEKLVPAYPLDFPE